LCTDYANRKAAGDNCRKEHWSIEDMQSKDNNAIGHIETAVVVAVVESRMVADSNLGRLGWTRLTRSS
jgi:hypothetical protein